MVESDSKAVILDIGSKYIKAGYSGDDEPTKFIDTIYGSLKFTAQQN